jgi:dienelactone hydrolase
MSTKSTSNFALNTNVWTEPGGKILKENLRQEARLLHQLHQPPVLLNEWHKKRQELRKRLLETAGVNPDQSGLGLDVREHGTIKMDSYRIVKLTYQSRKNLRVTANLFIPDAKGPFPAILNVHGHYPQGKLAEKVAARGHAFAKEGFVVLSVDAIGAGERGTVSGEFEHHGRAGVPLLSIGETFLGAQVYDNMRAIDLLQSLDYVDRDKIGVTGASGGGNQTMWISALDPRVKVSVPVVSAGTFESYVTAGNCWCETLPGGLQVTEEWGVLGLIAPNPLLILTAHREKLVAFLPDEMLRAYADTSKIYSLYGAEDKVSYQIIDQTHGYHPEMLRHSLGWFKHWLKGEGSALPCAIPEYKELPEKDLMCFPGKTRPKEIKSLIEYVSLRTLEAKKEFLSQKKLDRNRKTEELGKILRVPTGPDFLRCSELVYGEEKGRRFAKFAVESEAGILIPCAMMYPDKKFTSVVIAAHPDGKDVCLRQKAALDVLNEGKALCLVDLRGIGETRWEHVDDQINLYGARASIWLGRTMIGDWVKDLSAVRTAIGKLFSSGKVELLGFGETGLDIPTGMNDLKGTGDTGLAVLAAAVLDKRFAGVTVINMLSTYVVNGTPPVHRFSIFVPGILRWGDVSLMAALAKCELKIKSLVHPSGKLLSKKEYSDWQKEVKGLSNRLRQN